MPINERSEEIEGGDPAGEAGSKASRGIDERTKEMAGGDPAGSTGAAQDEAPRGISDLAALEYKLSKRGFRRDDVFLHECPECHEQAVLKYITSGRTGGRDIALCQACGVAKSWRSVAGLEVREQDLAFDLRKFLG
jgi:hypothetical protein